ncbi:amylo-alpha-1,6-glucosidase [Agromyces sp. ZXT2-6]|uniref:amylo-alpha-1,6-glucosidase n=1 Tax=Agromyces sp. ZXT2-6 TaxID=3461153 RepID=UPI004054AB7A
MIADLRHVPFSAAGSYLAFSRLTGTGAISETVRLRTVRGSALTPELLEVMPLTTNGPAAGTAIMTPEELAIEADSGSVRISFEGPGCISLRGDGVGFLLRSDAIGPYDTLVPVGRDEWRYLRYEARTTIRIRVRTGSLRSLSTWDGVRTGLLQLAGDPGTVIELVEEPEAAGPLQVIPEREAMPGFREFLASVPECPPEFTSTRELAAYVLWSALVEPSGFLGRPSMLMSKNWMTNLWSWDNCFNALSLERIPWLAEHQYFSVFDHQTQDGRLPDYINDAFRSFSFVKPPIHGWALRRMRERDVVDERWLAAAYEPLSRWTNWWLTARRSGSEGLPHYYHGNDSGWDNSTVFESGVPIESPDLAALLVLQMDCLSDVATTLGHAEQAEDWSRQSERMLDLLLDRLWTGDRFVARRERDGRAIDSSSLLTRVPVVLGNRLPRDVFRTLAEDIGSDDFLTANGLATESIQSAAYESDGYWRGPIWAPSTMLIVDGLAAGGESALADRIADAFCRNVARSGMAENFDALSGRGLRDRAYSWTASVFLTLASRYTSQAS